MVAMTGVVCVLFAGVIAAMPDEPPPFDEIVAQVFAATTPPCGYQVTVEQTISRQEARDDKSGTARSDNAGQKSAFVVAWDPVKRSFSTEPKSQSLDANGDKGRPPAKVRMAIDFPGFLRDMLAWPKVEVVSDELAGRSCFRVSGEGQGGKSSCTLWIDAEHWCVSRLLLDILGQRFAEADFEYRLVHDRYWLPSKLTVLHKADGSRVTQEFGAYTLENK